MEQGGHFIGLTVSFCRLAPYVSRMGSDGDRDAALAALIWQVELGADEAILDTPVNRMAAELPEPVQAPKADTSGQATDDAGAASPIGGLHHS